MPVYEISRKALKELEPRILGGRNHADEWDTARFVIVKGAYATRRRSLMHRDSLYISGCSHFDDLDDAFYEVSERIDHDYCMGYRLNVYEIWSVIDDDEDQQPKHDPEHVNEYGKKPFRHVFFKFDDKEPETATPPELPKEDLEELDRIFPPDETITDTLPRAVWSMYAETFNVLGAYDVPATLDVLVQMDDNTNGKRCLRFECEGVNLRRVGLYPKANLIEYSWTLEQPTDFVGLASFMQKMSGYGCSVSLMTTKRRDVEVAL